MAEHKQLGPLALANYYVGLATDGYRFDLLAIRDFVESGNKVQDIDLSNFLRKIEKVGDCDVWGDGGDNTLNGYNIITLKLVRLECMIHNTDNSFRFSTGNESFPQLANTDLDTLHLFVKMIVFQDKLFSLILSRSQT